MPLLRCQSVLTLTSGLPEDNVVNTFFVSTNPEQYPTGTIRDHWQTFMRGIYWLFSASVPASGHLLKVYDMGQPEPRVPLAEETWSFGTPAPSGETLPHQVALVGSYEGLRVSGQSQARRRGRMYFGPCNQAQDVNGRPGTAPIGVSAGLAEFAENLAGSSMALVVYSRVDDSAVTAVRAWCDNRWDVQRRRGQEATSRTYTAINLG